MKSRADAARILFVRRGFLFFFVLASARIFYLGFFDAENLAGRGARQKRATMVLPAERGPILDRNGDALALTVEAASIVARPHVAQLANTQIASLADAAGTSVDYVASRLRSPSPFVYLRRNVSPSRADAVAALGLPGVESEPGRTRVYPHGSLAGQILGIADVDGVGREGIERAYDRYLRAEKEVVVVERDARNRYVLAGADPRSKALRGATVELTIDADLQRKVEESLSSAVTEHEAESGVAIVMDVATGEILALANAPLFNPNRAEEKSPRRWRNRAILDRFEPGSTLKTFTAASALEAGVTWPEQRMFCENGSYRIGRRVIHDHDPYGWLTFADVIRVSSNICSAKVAEELGAERLDTTLRAFGFGSVTGIDLASEASGYLAPAKRWRPINLATISYGHGVSVTPLQLVRAYAALANGGRLLRPYIVSRVVGDDGTVLVENRPKVVGFAISPRTASTLTRILETVVTDGTGKAAAVEGVPVAGKTGTTRKLDETGHYSHKDYVASFAGYLPADAPRFAILVVVDTPRRGGFYGGTVAGPVFRSIGEYLADRAGLRAVPVPAPEVEDVAGVTLASWTESPAGEMPSYLGLSLREVLTQASGAGWEVEVEGSGFVVDQDPPPGAHLGKGRTLRLRLGGVLG